MSGYRANCLLCTVVAIGPTPEAAYKAFAAHHNQAHEVPLPRPAHPSLQPAFKEANMPKPCPECAAGKHPNCDGWTWDDAKDEPTHCPCQQAGHSA